MSSNPFTISFGKVPTEYIPRFQQTNQIISTFDNDPPTDQLNVIVGVRGTGKTVQMNDIVDHYRNESNWITIKINPEDHILESLCAELYHNNALNFSLKDTKISASLSAGPLKFELSKEKNGPQLSLTSQAARLLETARQKHFKILVAIDEISNTPQMAEFASALQIFISDHLPIFLLGTALYENLEALANKKNLSFLYRAPRIYLTPLSLIEISQSYQSIFNIDAEQATRMASLTKGYSFAFQVLGYICWEKLNKVNKDILLKDYDTYLREYSYKKIWEELSDNDRKTAIAIAEHEGDKVNVIREACHMTPYEFSPYRARLFDKGLIDTSQYGHLSFTLPRFAIFIKQMYDL